MLLSPSAISIIVNSEFCVNRKSKTCNVDFDVKLSNNEFTLINNKPIIISVAYDGQKTILHLRTLPLQQNIRVLCYTTELCAKICFISEQLYAVKCNSTDS